MTLPKLLPLQSERPRSVNATTLQEMRYAADLLQRADAAISREFDVLRSCGVVVDHLAALSLTILLSQGAMALHMLALQCEEAAQ